MILINLYSKVDQQNDFLLSQLTVRLRYNNSETVIGSGIIYYEEQLKNQVYILTAAHCLFEDDDSFQKPLEKIDLDFYNSKTQTYESLPHVINHDLLFKEKDKDVAVLIFEKKSVEKIIGSIPYISTVKERKSITTFILKGFPKATHGKELVCIQPTWSQAMTGVNKFQLNLIEDYDSWAVSGFSGSGIFLHSNNQLFLFGIFTRFRPEEQGRIIYCQYIETINELLDKNYLQRISFTFLGEHGLTPSYFTKHITTAIKNLGPRFNTKLNFRLPIVSCFNDIAKDEIFKHRLLHCIDQWLLDNRYPYTNKKKGVLKDIEEQFQSLRKDIIDWIPKLSWNADQKIDINPIINKINSLNETSEEKRNELQELQWEHEKENVKHKKDYNYRPPYEEEINWFRKVLKSNYSLLSAIDNVNIALSNFPCLIIDGEAGCGKSHLLGDIANEREKVGKPTLLLLGQLFKKEQLIWSNILTQLNLSCTKEELLTSLNYIGQQKESRVLILIDALNEGGGKDVWYNELNGFIEEVSKYPFIGLILTVRSTYWNVVIPKSVQTNNQITRFTHKGFIGNEYSALNLFCEYYELEQPHFPILAPEFTNPLFLQLVCEGIKGSNKRKFPQGFQGFSLIFNYYVKAIYQKLSEKREEYRLRPKLVEQAIHAIADASFKNKNSRTLPLEKAVELFDNNFSKHAFLLDDLIQESVLIRSMQYDYDTQNEIETIYFAYERFGDFFIADRLLQPYLNLEGVKVAFQKDNELGNLLKGWRNNGILEAFAILLPERYSLEIFEVFVWVFESKQQDLLGNIDDWLNHFLLDSFKWRNSQSIDAEKLINWFESDYFNLRYDEYLYRLIELSAFPNHPFNSDRLHQILIRYEMPQRDTFWHEHMIGYNGKDDNGIAYPLTRLLDWAWQPGVSEKIDSETARLTGQTLSWVLSTTNLILRDRTTKALVNLLEEQIEALVSILKVFENVDDMYISERLYAVAYGCALRTTSNDSLKNLSQFVFNNVFKSGNPPKHILLRDYARNTVEYAIYKKLPLDGDLILIHPPYHSQMPEKLPSVDDVRIYKMDHYAPDFEKKNGYMYNKIHHSVMDWDFGKYVIDSALHSFYPVSFTLEKSYKEFLKGLNNKQRKKLKLYRTLFETNNLTDEQKNNGRNRMRSGFDEMFSKIEQHLKEVEELLKVNLNEQQYTFFKNNVIPYLTSTLRVKNWQINFFDTTPIRCWIVQRVFALGYDVELHGNNDSMVDRLSHRSDRVLERIGKKYQWIAFYEIMSMITDNYKMKERWSGKSNNNFYKGPWQLYLRDIDPIFVTKNKNNDEDEEDDNDENLPRIGSLSNTNWWFDSPYDYWTEANSLWIKNEKDLPDPKGIIQRSNNSKVDWLYLKVNVDWKEPKPIGQDRYEIHLKHLWYIIQSYLVKKKDKKKIIKWLNEKPIRDTLPETRDVHSLFNRENYWSPICKNYELDDKSWEKIENSNLNVIVSTSPAVGSLSDDKSGAHLSYDMPCITLFEGLNLEYSKNDGEFKTSNGEIVVSNENPQGVLIRKQLLMEYLNKNDLEIIWTVRGEKQSYGGLHTYKENYMSRIEGIYSFEDGVLLGKLKLTQLND